MTQAWGEPLAEFADDATVYAGHCRSVEPERDGDVTTVAAGAGETVLTFDWVEDFYPGATLLIRDDTPTDDATAPGVAAVGGGRLVQITAADPERPELDVDPDACTVRLTAPLEAAVPVETRVDVWDPTSAAPVVTYWAAVSVDEWATSEAAEVKVDPIKVPHLQQGIREGSGVVVTFARERGRGQTDFELLTIEGREPWIDGTGIAPDTLPVPELPEGARATNSSLERRSKNLGSNTRLPNTTNL